MKANTFICSSNILDCFFVFTAIPFKHLHLHKRQINSNPTLVYLVRCKWTVRSRRQQSATWRTRTRTRFSSSTWWGTRGSRRARRRGWTCLRNHTSMTILLLFLTNFRNQILMKNKNLFRRIWSGRWPCNRSRRKRQRGETFHHFELKEFSRTFYHRVECFQLWRARKLYGRKISEALML